jgi:hypothetical protein
VRVLRGELRSEQGGDGTLHGRQLLQLGSREPEAGLGRPDWGKVRRWLGGWLLAAAEGESAGGGRLLLRDELPVQVRHCQQVRLMRIRERGKGTSCRSRGP